MASEIAALSGALDTWELIGYIAVSAVILGCAGEAIHEFTAWFRGCPWWGAKGGKASALLLVAALAVELVAQVNVNISSGQIIAFLNDRAASAIKDAALANERAAHASIDAGELQIRVAEAELGVAFLQRSTGPRRIDHQIFLQQLKGREKPDNVFIVYSKNSSDGLFVAGELADLFREAEWPFTGGVSVDRDSPLLAPPPSAGGRWLSSGISIVSGDPMPSGNIDGLKTPYVALLLALTKTLGSCESARSRELSPAAELWPNQLRVVIFPRS